MTPSKNGISVIICCYNSEARLPETLRHLALQQVADDVLWEIILVNNVSTDNTKKVAKSEWDKYNSPNVGFRIVDEPIPGLSNARHKGIAEANFEYIIFCDDDNWLDQDYLQIAYKLISSNDKIGAVGGQSNFQTDMTILPNWFWDFKICYAVGQQAKKSMYVTKRQLLWGSGMTIRRGIYLEAFKNFPSLLLDRTGKNLSSGGDSEICKRLILLGFELYYTEELKFTHFIPRNRITLNYKTQLLEAFSKSDDILFLYSTAIKIFDLQKISKFKLLIKSIIRYYLSKSFLQKNWDHNFEAIVVYLLSGKSLQPIDRNLFQIRTFLTRIKIEKK